MMFRLWKQKVARHVLLMLWPLLIPCSLIADEAEIFYQAEAARVNSNVLFVLDSSGSMDLTVPGSGGKSRMQVMQETFRELLEEVPENLNVGLMNYANADFLNSYQWSSVGGVSFPASPVNEEAAVVIGSHAATDNIPDAVPGAPVRKFLADVVDSWEPRGYTPIVDSLYEATRYFRGEASAWGKYPPKYYWAAHPSTYSGSPSCKSPTERLCRLEWGECNGTQTGCHVKPVSSCCNWVDNASGGFCEHSDYSCSVDVTHCQHTECAGVSGDVTYKSPIEHSCQPSFMVLMSDGKPQYPYFHRGSADGTQHYPESAFPDRAHDPALAPELKPVITGSQIPDPIPALIRSSCVDKPSGFGSGTCGPELTRFLAANDQRSALDGDQTVETFTIAFGLADEPQGTAYLASLATASGGAYTANNAEELAQVMKDVFDEINRKSYSFSSPSFSISEDSLLSNGQDVYVPVFSSSHTSVWSGNLRKLRLSDSNRLVGAGNREVLTDNGQFVSNAQDLWSAKPHGVDAAVGGAASRLPPPARRVRRTDAGGNSLVNISSSTSTALISSGMLSSDTGTRRTRHALLDFFNNTTGEPGSDGLSSGGWYINCAGNRVTVKRPFDDPVNIKDVTTCPADSVSAKQRNTALDFARGYDVTETGEIDRASERKHLGDILNSKPVVVNYESKSLVFVATNEGYLHAFNADTGVEEWAFMPSILLKNQLAFLEGKENNQHVYGLDGALTLWNYDANQDGQISRSSDSRDRRMLFFGMRRGGNMYYALDITNPSTPVISWKISPEAQPGATTFGFSGLGETWSKPTLSKMRVASAGGSSSEVKHVLVFGGGYDPKYDEYQRGARASGTARGADVYIVDAQSGALLWSAKRNGGSVASGLTHSVASDIRVLDMDNNGELDRLYFADLGGNVWRTDLSLDVASAGSGVRFSNKTLLSKLASLGDVDGGDGDHRKFFYEPDTALRMSNGEPVMTVSLGSGYRSHPLDQGDQDRFYVLLDRDVYHARATSAAAITHADLKAAATDGSGFGGSILDYPDRDGWYISLPHNAEKVLAGSVTFLDKVLFTTFAHADAHGVNHGVGPCLPLETSARAYVLDVMTGKAVADLQRLGGAGSSSSSGRRTPFMVAGGTGEILDAPQLIFSQLSSSAGGDCSAGSCQQSVSVRVGKLDVPLLDLENTANTEGSTYSEMVDLTKLLPRLYWRDNDIND